MAVWWLGLAAVHAATAIWTGADLLNSNWTAPNNWARLRPAAAGDDLTFPSGAARLANNNNFTSGTAFNLLTFSGAGYVISGNPLALTGGMTASHGAGSTLLHPALTLDADQAFSVTQAGAVLACDGTINLNGHTLTVGGEGTLVLSNNVTSNGSIAKQDGGVLRIAGAPSYTGLTVVNGGTLQVDGTLANSFALLNAGSTLTGSGTVDGFTANGGTVGPGVAGAGLLRSKRAVNFLAGSVFQVELGRSLLGLPEVGQLSVTGAVQLSGCTLQASLGSRFTAAIGDTFTILKNDGGEPINGTFAGLSEGAQLTISGQRFLISYVGGTGNDVVLTLGKPRWTFSILAAVSQATADYYGGLGPVGLLISNQIATVNHHFNDPDVFAGYFNFVVTSVYVFSDSAVSEISVAHPNQDFKVVYDGYPTQGGGWYGNYLTIHHSWAVTNSGGLFGSTATDGIVHEFGHSRGAIDLYALDVDPASNPINHQTFTAVQSIMNYPYGERIWDEYTQHLINENAATVAPPISYITAAFPSSIRVKVTDPDGGGFPGVEVRLFPVPWFSSSVSNVALLSSNTDANGEFILPANPFGPNTAASPWNIRYPNFLVAARYKTTTNYAWMPLYDVQNAYFDTPFTLPPRARPFDPMVRLPVSTFDSWRLSHFSAAELANGSVSGELADPDGDGINNLMEYALALDPHTPNPPHLLSCSREGDFVVASYKRRKLSAAPDVSFAHQMAKSLAGPWSPAPFVSVLDQGSTEVVGFREALAIDQSTGNFYRLKVTRVP